MDAKKQAILEALSRFANQRPGIEPGNYGDWKGYRSESRSVTRDLHDARTLLRAVSWRDSLTGDELENAFRAFSGRLTCNVYKAGKTYGESGATFSHPSLTVNLDYCTGQYFPTEYRKAVCAVLAAALWDYTRGHCMPTPVTVPPGTPGNNYSYPAELYAGKSGGDWLRDHFRQEFGRGLAGRYFR